MKITFGTTFSWGYQHARMCVCTMCVCVGNYATQHHALQYCLPNSCTCLDANVWLLLLQQLDVCRVVVVHQPHLLFECVIPTVVYCLQFFSLRSHSSKVLSFCYPNNVLVTLKGNRHQFLLSFFVNNVIWDSKQYLFILLFYLFLV